MSELQCMFLTFSADPNYGMNKFHPSEILISLLSCHIEELFTSALRSLIISGVESVEASSTIISSIEVIPEIL